MPVEFDGDALVLNMSTSAAGSIRVEIQDASGSAISGFSLAECDELFGDDIDRVVTWNGSLETGRLRGEALRLRIAIVDADLYSIASV